MRMDTEHHGTFGRFIWRWTHILILDVPGERKDGFLCECLAPWDVPSKSQTTVHLLDGDSFGKVFFSVAQTVRMEQW